MRIKDVIRRIERTASPRHAASWDNCGPQVAGTQSECSRLAVSLDPVPASIEAALAWGAQLILTHHPLLLKPRLPDRLDGFHRVLSLLFAKGAWLYSAHTSLDVQTSGPVSLLAGELGLVNRRVIEPVKAQAALMRLKTDGAAARDAALAILAEHPSCLSAEPVGERLLDVTCFDEDRDRLLAACAGPDGVWPQVLRVRLESPVADLGFGIVGDLPSPLAFGAFADLLASSVRRDFWTMAGPVPETVARVGYCTGSGADLAQAAFAMGADVFITGDLKYHAALETVDGLIIDVGHFSLEEAMMGVFADELREDLSPQGVEVKFFCGADPFSVRLTGTGGDSRF